MLAETFQALAVASDVSPVSSIVPAQLQPHVEEPALLVLAAVAAGIDPARIARAVGEAVVVAARATGDIQAWDWTNAGILVAAMRCTKEDWSVCEQATIRRWNCLAAHAARELCLAATELYESTIERREPSSSADSNLCDAMTHATMAVSGADHAMAIVEAFLRVIPMAEIADALAEAAS